MHLDQSLEQAERGHIDQAELAEFKVVLHKAECRSCARQEAKPFGKQIIIHVVHLD